MPRALLTEEERRERRRLKAKRWRSKNPGYKSKQHALAKRKYREDGKAKDRMRRHKLLLVDLFGGVCQCCGESFHYSCMDFHHKNPDSKNGQVKIDRGWKTLANEAAKCVLLCANCHRLYHYFERNPECETIKTFVHLDNLRLLQQGCLPSPSLQELLEAENRLVDIMPPNRRNNKSTAATETKEHVTNA